MMGNLRYGNMMDWGMGGFGLVGSVIFIALAADLILLGIWLWREINKK